MTRGIGLLALATACVVVVASARGDEAQRWIVEPTPEAPGAVDAAKADVERAQAAAKKKNYAEAVQLFEQVARTHPAAVHDCNLALVYLRAGALTRAQLFFDLAGLRNAQRPTWCTGDLSTQLSTAMRAAGYVPVTIDVVPGEAVIDVGGVSVRGIRVVWLPTGVATLAASAPGRVTTTQTFTVAAPTTRIAVEVPVEQASTADAGVEPPVDAAPAITVPVDAAPAEPIQPPPPPRGKRPLQLYIAGGVAGASLATAVVFGLRASAARSDANELYPSDPAFDDHESRFSTSRTIAIATGVVGLAAAGYAGYLLATDARDTPRGVAIVPTGDGAMVTFSGVLGGRP